MDLAIIDIILATLNMSMMMMIRIEYSVCWCHMYDPYLSALSVRHYNKYTYVYTYLYLPLRGM